MRYELNDDGLIKDTLTGFVLPDNYWTCDLLNLKEKQIKDLQESKIGRASCRERV